MIALLKGLFSSGIVGSVERIASEYIETDKESAEAKSLLVKVLDPNGKMRRDLSRFASRAYGFYLVTTVTLIFAHAYGIGEGDASKESIEAMTALFTPITSAWGLIVSASFGVNVTNVLKK
jgi:predicted membrane protein